MSQDTINLIIATVITIAATFGISYLFYRKSFTIWIKSRNIKNARKEVVTLLSVELAKNKGGIELSIVKAITNSIYGEHKVDSIPPTEIQQLFEALITNITKSPFISPSRKNELSNKALVLKEGFGKRETDLGQAISNWQQVSIFKISIQVVFILAVGIFTGLTAFIISAIVNPAIWDNFIEIMWLIGIVATLSGFLQYRKAKANRDESSHHLNMALEEKVIRALERHMPDAVLEKNVKVADTGHLIEVDLIMSTNGAKIPVEIKHRLVRTQTIEELANVMKTIGSRKGLLVTGSSVGNTIKELARQKGIIVLDNVASEDEIVNRLKYTKLFD